MAAPSSFRPSGSGAKAPMASAQRVQGDAAFEVPRAFGRLLLLKLIARGGMGDVYLAATTGIEGAERPCVVKTIRRDHIHDGSFLARFLDEARVQSQLHHPGVAQVVEAATDESGEPYSVVEYVEGRSLADVRTRAIQSGCKIGWPEAVAIVLEMTNALAHVHERSGADGTPLGIVHRDLSPQNVMVGYAGEIKLIDFGTARGHNRRCHTVAGVVFAKPGYVAPEVARQQVGDGRIDLYAVGIMLWELVAGRRYLAGDPAKHLEDASNGALVVPPVAKDAGAPAELDVAIDKLTQNDPDDRYASASLAAAALGKLLTLAPALPSGERTVRGRVGALMHALWPHEPGRSRADFSKLLKEARPLSRDSSPRMVAATPSAPEITQQAAEHMNEGAGTLGGTAYKLLDKIGEGASGEVWSAEHLELGRKVALKLLAPEHASAKDAIDRFRREARAVAAISHPNLVGLYDFGKARDGRVYLAMELLDGEALERRLDREPMSWKGAAELAIQASHALEAAHAAGLVHRDLKPANLFVTKNGTLKLLDFGVAMALSDVPTDEKRQKGFAIFGTPEYMAPEQVAGEPVDARCDVYALGCVLYEMLTGEPPFSGKSTAEILGKQVREAVIPPRERSPSRKIPEALENVVLHAMSKKREERFPSAVAMRRAIESVIEAPSNAASKKRSVGMRVFAVGMVACGIAIVSHAGTRSAPSPSNVPVEAVAGEPEPTASATESAPLAMQGAPFVPPAVNPEPSGDKPPTRDRLRDKLESARSAARQKPGDPHLLRAWARAAIGAGDLRDARRAVDTWILHDSTPEPRVMLANVLEASGRHQEARTVLEEVLETHPDSEPARRLHARLGVTLPPADNAQHRGQVAEK
jgi:eukaryotic-like serine/threonine-protein kinase